MRIHVIGDLHGFYGPYESLLINGSIIDENGDWCADNDHLWLIGDIFDRGNRATSCIDLTMKIQKQANQAGGSVQCLLGNHELMFLAMMKFRDELAYGKKIQQQWLLWGGQQDEITRITDQHIEWLCRLPAMALVEDRLLIHGDNLSYVNYGNTISQVNQFFFDLVESDDFGLWQSVLREFSDRGAFDLDISGPRQAYLMLKMYGGQGLIHGHTPIPLSTGSDSSALTRARIYGNGLCCNVDGGIYLGNPGFIFRYGEQE